MSQATERRREAREHAFEDVRGLMGLARDLGVCAEQIATTAARLAALLSDPVLLRSVAASPRTGARVSAQLGRAIAGGLGCGTETNRLGKVIAMLTGATGSESLPALVAASALKARIRALSRLHPELREDPELAALIAAIEGDRQAEAVRRFRHLMKERGTQEALGAIAPVFIELSGLIALLGENPFNDAVGWNMAVGKPPTGEPLLGVSMTWVSAFDEGEASAVPTKLPKDLKLDASGTIAGHMRNIASLRPHGYMLVQRVRAGDGAERWLLLLPGMTADTIAEPVAAMQLTESHYTRALRTAFEAAGVPDGAEVALVGHSQGGVVAMNIVSDPELVARYRFTHLVAVGAPVDYKKPLVRDLWVASVTNQHDIVPALDGRGFGAVHDPHPDWYEVDFADGRHGFPACHAAERYAENLTGDIPEAAGHIDRKLAGYRGEVVSTAAFRLGSTEST